MPASFLHGIEVLEFNLGPVPINVVNSAVVGLVGTAPLFAVPGALPLWDPSWLVGAAPQWSPSTPEAVGNLIVDSNGNTQKCAAAGTTGTGIPNWARALNSTTPDGTAVWTLIAIGSAAGQQCIDANGNVQSATAITLNSWTAAHAYNQGDLIVDSNGNTQPATTAGSSGGSGPNWSTTLSGTTADGTGALLWTLVAIGKAAVTKSSSPGWSISLSGTTADSSSSATGTVTWTLTQKGPIPNLQTPVLISGSNLNSGALGQAGIFGPLIQGYTVPYALNQVFQQGAGQVIVVNVFDQTRHNSPISAQTYTLPSTGNQLLNLGHMGVGQIKLTNSAGTVTYVEGADFTLDRANGVISALGGGLLSAGQSVVVSGLYADPSKVTDADLVGTVTSSAYTGMQTWKLCYGLLGFFPKLLIAPSFGAASGSQNVGSQDPTVASGLAAVAAAMRAMYFLDCPPGTPASALLANRGANGNSWNTSDKRAILCGPQELFNDTGILPTGITLSSSGTAVATPANTVHAGPYSAWVAGAVSARDLAQGYWWSPANMQIVGPLGPDVAIYASALDAAADTNTLNAQGIVTAFSAFGTGVRVWGNRSAGYPAYSTPDVFIPVRRTMDVIEQSVQLAMLQFVDQPISNGLITAILASVNAFIRTLIQRGALVAGSASYNPLENPAAQVAAGQLVFDIDCMPPPPAERLTFNVYIDTTLLGQLGTNAQG